MKSGVNRARIGRLAKQKGNVYERKISKLLSKMLKIDLRRVPASGGLDLKGDICYADFKKEMPFIIDTKNNKTLISAAMRNEIMKTIEDTEKSDIDDYMIVFRDNVLHEDFVLTPLSTIISIMNKDLKL